MENTFNLKVPLDILSIPSFDKIHCFWHQNRQEYFREWISQDNWHPLQQQLHLEALCEDLQQCCIRNKPGNDIIHWGYKSKGMFTTKESHQILNTPNEPPEPGWTKLWILKTWPKNTTFL